MSELAEKIAAQVLELVDRGNSMPIVLIDGRSNSGKSTLAAEVQNLIFKNGESAPRVVHMDEIGINTFINNIEKTTNY